MNIALYYPWIYLKSGVERTIFEIVKRSKHKYTIFTNRFDKENTYREFRNFEVIELRRVPVERSIPSVLSAAIVIATQKINLKGYDALLVHCDGLGDLIMARNSKIPAFCFCYTPLRPVFDEYYRERVLNKRAVVLRLPFFFFSFAFKKLDRFLWKRYKYAIFISKETLRRAKKGRLLTTLKGRFKVLHPGVDLKSAKPSWVYKPYFFLPGRIKWTKNIELGIRAFLSFKNNFPKYSDFQLVIAGQLDKSSKPYLKKLMEISGQRLDIKFVISPSETALKKLYSECYAVLFPPFNEDWGIVPLEANSYGKPVIAVNRGGVKESQINGKTGFLVKPSAIKFAEKMSYLVKNKNILRKMGRNARINAKKYDWEVFIKEFDETLKKLFEKTKQGDNF